MNDGPGVGVGGAGVGVGVGEGEGEGVGVGGGTGVGRIAPGHLADLVVIDRDLTRISPAEIQGAQILATYVGGQPRFEA